MRRLSQTAVLLALTACMSPSGKVKKTDEVSAAETDISRPTAPGLPEVTESQPDVNPATEADALAAHALKEGTDARPTDPNCQTQENSEALPTFLARAQVYVREAASPCLTPSGEAGVLGKSKIIASGLPCTQNFGRLNRLYESSISRPETVKFHMPLNCLAIPDQDTPKKFLTSYLPPDAVQSLVAFYPIQVSYWEFKETPDSGFHDALVLKSDSGRSRFVKWWAQDADEIPVRVFGRESSFIPSGDLYQADIRLVKRRGSQFQVQVDSIKVLDEPEVDEALERCKARNHPSACTSALK